jgi:hypothetical protein
MKNKMTIVVLPLAALLFATTLEAQTQVSLTVSPSVISNTYPGLITLSVTGLTNGEAIAIQRWMDLNGNGVIDAGEPMMDAFKITDNDASQAIIGGVTNVNLPIDLDAAPGAITTTLNFVPAMTLDTMAGHYLYRVASPSGRFAPVTASFTVTNTPLPQSISGTVYGPDGVTPLPNAVVVAQDQQQNEPVCEVVADANGHYVLPLPVSSYSLLAILPNYLYDMSHAPSVALTNGMAATNNLFLTNGTATISGSVFDAGYSNAIGGLLMTLQSGNYFAVTFSDTNGNYSAPVSPSFWKVQPEKQRLVRRMYVLPESQPFQFDVTSGTATNANIPLPKANALFYGRVTDNSGKFYPNVEIDGSAADTNGNNFYDAKGYTDQNGYFSVAVLGDATNSWFCSINSAKNNAFVGFVVNQFNGQTMTVGQAVQENFVALPANDRITGHVSEGASTNVVGVGLNAMAVINGNTYQSLDAHTDMNGNYSIAVADGQWNVQFFNGNSSDTLDSQGLADIIGQHTVSVPPTNAVLNLTVYPIGTPYISQPHRMGASQFGFNLNGAVNASYTVQVCTAPTNTNWSNLLSIQLTNSSTFITDLNATNNLRFYRILKN